MNHPYNLHKKLYLLLKEAGLHNERHSIVSSFTDGRTENSAEMSAAEVNAMIKYLEGFAKETAPAITDFMLGDRMRKRILSLCYEYGWTTNKPGGKLGVNYYALNGWMLKYGYLHKPMNDYTYAELPKLLAQFEQVVKGYLQKSA